MSRSKLKRMRQPAKRYRPDKNMPNLTTKTAATEENKKRAASLRQFAEHYPDHPNTKPALKLADRLDPKRPAKCKSVASELRRRKHRSRIGGHVVKLAKKTREKGANVYAITIWPGDMEHPYQQLDRATPHRSANELRNTILKESKNDSVVFTENDWLIASLLIKYDPELWRYSLGYSLLVSGEMAPVILQRLRRLPNYRGKHNSIDVRISAGTEIAGLFGPVRHLLPNYCILRGPGWVGSPRHMRHRPLHQLYHCQRTEILLWLDQQPFSNLCWTMGLKVTRNGFIPTGKAAK